MKDYLDLVDGRTGQANCNPFVLSLAVNYLRAS